MRFIWLFILFILLLGVINIILKQQLPGIGGSTIDIDLFTAIANSALVLYGVYLIWDNENE